MKADFFMSEKPLASQGLIRNSNSKPVILAFIGNYLPGYKAGGILRTLVNTVDHLCDEFEFRIVTRDRDLGDDSPYADIKISQWQNIGEAMVYYLSPQSNTIKDILNVIDHTRHDVLYLNSFFDILTIKVLLIRKFFRDTLKPVIIAPRGEFAWASLRQKYFKKIIYIHVARLLGLYKRVTWQASSEYETMDIMRVMKVKYDEVHTALDLPSKIIPDEMHEVISKPLSDSADLRIVFLSRIAREKNLDFALKVLNKVSSKVVFDVYGPAENVAYWQECKDLISQLPDNIEVNYFGSVTPGEVLHIFSRYDLFLFPTGGENYGHVIGEALIVGTPVLISTETPWRNLQADGLGWDIDLSHMDSFVETIEQVSLLSPAERLKKRNALKRKIMERLLDSGVLEANRELFRKQSTVS